jgi:thiol-disulfide isomerase/thioredoxin
MTLCTRTLPALAAALLLATAAGAGELRVFDADSMQTIEQEHAGSRFIVAVWATDCPPCRRELALLSDFSADHPEVPVVLIATDPPDNAAAVDQVLESFTLPAADAWRFGAAGAERLRYTIDPGWRGEMPRSYLYGEDGERVGISGPVSAELLQRWLQDTGR